MKKIIFQFPGATDEPFSVSIATAAITLTRLCGRFFSANTIAAITTESVCSKGAAIIKETKFEKGANSVLDQ